MSAPPDDTEKNNLERDVVEAQRQFKELLQLNDEFQNENGRLDTLIASREKFYTVLIEKHAAEIAQLEMEDQGILDGTNHEITENDLTIQDLTLQHDKFKRMEEENEELRLSLENMIKQFGDHSMEHALELHSINKETRKTREEMELAMRRELSTLDLVYQKQAFSSLVDYKKKNMLRNSQLKDEISLQGVGINNLTTRLTRQELGYAACMKDIRKMNRKAKRQRDRLAILTTTKVNLGKLVVEILGTQKKLDQRREAYEASLSQEPLISILEQELLKFYHQVLLENSMKVMWMERNRCLENIYMEIKPVNKVEDKGSYNPGIFKIPDTLGVTSQDFLCSPFKELKTSKHYIASKRWEASPSALKQTSKGTNTSQSHSSHNNNHHHNHGNHAAHEKMHDEGIKLSEIIDIIKADDDLTKIMAGVAGKESNLVNDSDGLTNDQNMVAWSTVQLISMWHRTETEADAKLRSGGQSSQQLAKTQLDERLFQFNQELSLQEIAVDVPMQEYDKELEVFVNHREKIHEIIVETKEAKHVENNPKNNLPEANITAIIEDDEMSENSESGSDNESDLSPPVLENQLSEITEPDDSYGPVSLGASTAAASGSGGSSGLFIEIPEICQAVENPPLSFEPMLTPLEGPPEDSDQLWESIAKLTAEINTIEGGSDVLDKSVWYRKPITPNVLPKIDYEKLEASMSSSLSQFNNENELLDRDVEKVQKFLKLGRNALAPPTFQKSKKSKEPLVAQFISAPKSLESGKSIRCQDFLQSLTPTLKKVKDPLSLSNTLVKSSSNFKILHRAASDGVLPNQTILSPIAVKLKDKLRGLSKTSSARNM